MVKYLSANIGLIKTVLDDAMQDSHKIMLYTNQSYRGYDLYVGLGWFSTTNFGSQIIWHNGGVYGYNAFAVSILLHERGVVILQVQHSRISPWQMLVLVLSINFQL